MGSGVDYGEAVPLLPWEIAVGHGESYFVCCLGISVRWPASAGHVVVILMFPNWSYGYSCYIPFFCHCR